ncbi:site-specific integrase [uncultured Desulfovibrio sp.]|uniref:tyrosine-type recombinase/integrase n=1 Tax=uncultured Desulfovibrio sp. TaxID=167968 RepID=UPI002630764F|nr:site-specific integrase [uncultured Desulfovibrio sp.]
MAGRKKLKTQYPGVRYYEHPSRKQRNGQPDRFYSIRYKLNGRLVEETLGWATDGWTADKAHAVRANIKQGQRTGQGPQTLGEARENAAKNRAAAAREAEDERVANMLLQDFFEQHYLPNAKRTKRSWLTDEQRFNKAIRPVLGMRPLRSISRADVQRLIDALVDQGAAASTVKQYRGILSHLYALAGQEEVAGRKIFEGVSPVQGVRVPPIRNARERFLTADEADALIKAARKLPCPDLHDCIVLSLNTGLRLGELRRLEWPDVDMINAMVTVREEAQRKPGGKVPLNAAAMRIFTDRLAGRKGPARGLVFPPVAGGAMRGNLTNAFRDLVDRLGFNEGLDAHDRARRVVFHTLRHTFASWLALGGTDIYRIQKLMRHKSITMTMRYAHLIPDATRQAVHDLKPPTATR